MVKRGSDANSNRRRLGLEVVDEVDMEAVGEVLEGGKYGLNEEGERKEGGADGGRCGRVGLYMDDQR